MKYKIGQLLSLRPFMLLEKIKNKISNIAYHFPKCPQVCVIYPNAFDQSPKEQLYVFFEQEYGRQLISFSQLYCLFWVIVLCIVNSYSSEGFNQGI